MDRLQKVIAQAGIASRRKAEELIATGHVKVNGKVITEMGYKVAENDGIEVDGVPITEEQHVYFLFYKPRQVISAVSDDKKRRVVTEFFPEVMERIYPVGRLDYDTSGLLLLTNDGDFSNLLTHPKYEVDKTYVAKTEGIPSTEALQKLHKGIRLEGRMTSPAKTAILSTDQRKNTAIVSVTIHEGRNHQVKKMLERVGFPVQKLKRETYGFLTLKGLQPGQWRELSNNEIHELKLLAEKNK